MGHLVGTRERPLFAVRFSLESSVAQVSRIHSWYLWIYCLELSITIDLLYFLCFFVVVLLLASLAYHALRSG